MAKKGSKPAKLTRVSSLKPGLRGASRLVQSRVHAGIRSATLSRQLMLRFSSSILLALFALSFVALWLGGHLSAMRDNLISFKQDRLMAVGFTVERIDVSGEGRLNEADVRAVIGIYEGGYFFGADLKRAQRNTESLPWVDRAVVRRLWPNRIVVQLVETTPYALYQENGIVHLTDRDGAIIVPYTPQTARLPDHLRLFIGTDAAVHASEITELMEAHPVIWQRTKALTRHPSGRWDLTLIDGQIVRLPRRGTDKALRRFAKIEGKMAQRFSIVDLRLNDRITLTPVTSAEA